MGVFGAVDGGRWRPGIGDPTVVGWLTVVAYAAAAALCLRAAGRERGRTGRHSPFWVALFALTAALGVNKQLDFQTLLTEVARDAFRDWGLYARRRPFQLLFIGAVAAACAALVAAAVRLAGRDPGRRTAAVGLVLLMGFVVVRAASFHHVDALLAATVGGLKWNWVFELGGIGIIAAGAARVPAAGPRPGQPGAG